MQAAMQPLSSEQASEATRVAMAKTRELIQSGALAGGAADPATAIDVFTTRPDTLFGATYMVLAPEHPLVDTLVADAYDDDVNPGWTAGAVDPAAAVVVYRARVEQMTDVDRQENKEKTGVYLGVHATNPVNGESIPVFIADYVLMGYGTGAIMAVPAQDERDWDFAMAFGLPIIRTSVDHGTALDIAGKGEANPSSLFEAVKLAKKLLSN